MSKCKVQPGVVELLNKEANKPLTAYDVFNMADKKCNLVMYEDILDMDNIEDMFIPQEENEINLPFDPNSVLILYQAEPNFGHWVLLTQNVDGYNYLDSYGEQVDKPLDYVTQKYKHKKHLAKLLFEGGKKVYYNDNKLQKLSSDIATCGRYCALFLKNSNMNVDDFADKIKKIQKNSNLTMDQVVTLLTLK